MNQLTVQNVMLGAALGLAGGYSLNKAQIAKPHVIKDQFEFKDWTLAKTVATTVATTTAVITLGHVLGRKELHVPPYHPYTDTIGGLLMGAGMYVTGSSPGTVLAQIGAGSRRALVVAAGGLAGAFTYGIFWPSIRGSSIGLRTGFSTMQGWLGVPYTYLAIPLAVAAAGVAYTLHQAQPEEEKVDMDPTALIGKEHWSSITNGLFTGLLQVPAYFILDTTLGTSSAYATLAGAFAKIIGMNTMYFEAHTTPYDWWQVAFDVSMIVGSSLAQSQKKISVYPKESLDFKNASVAFLGGFALVFGSRMANSSVEGHALSGIPQLAISSFAVSTCIMVGGWVTAGVMKAFKGDL